MIRVFSVAITPVGKGRPRLGANGNTYTPEATELAETEILAAYHGAYPRSKPHAGPVELEVTSVFLPPASWPKWKRTLALQGLWPCMHRIDCDNAAKTVMDALEDDPDCFIRGAYLNDRQVVDLHTRKDYGPTPRILVQLRLLEEPNKP